MVAAEENAMTLTDFLLARIAEDEQRGQHPNDDGPLDSWHTRGCAVHPQGLEKTWCDCDVPARVLAECEAKRQVIGEHRPVDWSGLGMTSPNACHICGIDAGMGDWEYERNSFPCVTLRALATIYADHPDYRDEWRP